MFFLLAPPTPLFEKILVSPLFFYNMQNEQRTIPLILKTEQIQKRMITSRSGYSWGTRGREPGRKGSGKCTWSGKRKWHCKEKFDACHQWGLEEKVTPRNRIFFVLTSKKTTLSWVFKVTFSLALPSWLLKLPFQFTTAPRKRNESSLKAMHLKLASCDWASRQFSIGTNWRHE